MDWVERDLKDHLVPIPLPWAGTPSVEMHGISITSHILNILIEAAFSNYCLEILSQL